MSRALRKFTFLYAVLGLAAATCGWQLILATKVDQPRKGSAVSIVSQLNFRYDAAFVWSILTSAQGLQELAGISIEPADREKSLTKAGDWVAASVGDDRGRLVVTMIGQNRDFRLVFEPESAAYVIHKRFLVATAGNGCVIQYWSMYTEFDSGADDRAAKEREKVVAAAGAFRAVVESRVTSAPRSPHGH